MPGPNGDIKSVAADVLVGGVGSEKVGRREAGGGILGEAGRQQAMGECALAASNPRRTAPNRQVCLAG